MTATDPPRAPPPVTTRNAVVFLAVIAGGATLKWAQDILTPLALALFLAVMIDSFARVLTMRAPGFPKALALPTAVVLSLLLFGVSIWIVVDNGKAFFDHSSEYVASLNAIIAKFAPVVSHWAPGLELKVAPTIGDLVKQLALAMARDTGHHDQHAGTRKLDQVVQGRETRGQPFGPFAMVDGEDLLTVIGDAIEALDRPGLRFLDALANHVDAALAQALVGVLDLDVADDRRPARPPDTLTPEAA